MPYLIDPDIAPRIHAAWTLATEYLADHQWHRTAQLENHLLLHTDLAECTIRQLLEQQSARRVGLQRAVRRGNARGRTDTREIRLT